MVSQSVGWVTGIDSTHRVTILLVAAVGFVSIIVGDCPADFQACVVNECVMVWKESE